MSATGDCALGYRRISSGIDDMKQECQRRLVLSTNPNVIGGDPAVRRVVKGSWSDGAEALEEQFATHLDAVQHIDRQLEQKEMRKTT